MTDQSRSSDHVSPGATVTTGSVYSNVLLELVLVIRVVLTDSKSPF